MAAGVLMPSEFDSVATQSALLEGDPVMEWISTPCGSGYWVHVHGWNLPLNYFKIICLWLMLGGKAYHNRVPYEEWDHKLRQANPHKEDRWMKYSSKQVTDCVFSELNRKNLHMTKVHQIETPHVWLKCMLDEESQLEPQLVA